MPEKSVRDIWLSTDEIKAIRDVKVSRENRIRKYLRNLYMFIHFIYLIFFYPKIRKQSQWQSQLQ